MAVYAWALVVVGFAALGLAFVPFMSKEVMDDPYAQVLLVFGLITLTAGTVLAIEERRRR